MTVDDVIVLIGQTYELNEHDVPVATPTEHGVFCSVLSITRSEFFGAGRNGLNPDFEFQVFHGDYNGERLIRYKDNLYAVYRTFLPDGEDYIELYAQRKGGTNG